MKQHTIIFEDMHWMHAYIPYTGWQLHASMPFPDSEHVDTVWNVPEGCDEEPRMTYLYKRYGIISIDGKDASYVPAKKG